MSIGILGRKLGMTQVFTEGRQVVPATAIMVKPNVVLQKKTQEKDGYEAIQIGLVDGHVKSMTKPLAGHLKTSGVGSVSKIKEVQGSFPEMEVGAQITVENFSEVKMVDVTGTSKGKGFQGVVKRYGFRGGRSTHGSMFHRAPGSIGASAYPSRVFKGTRMPGQMGSKQVKTKNLKVVRVDLEKGIILLKGSVPGARGEVVYLHAVEG